MCGIVGYLGTEPEAITAVLDGLLLLQNRGYDSCGISTLHDGELATNKYASTTINNALIVLTQVNREIEQYMQTSIDPRTSR